MQGIGHERPTSSRADNQPGMVGAEVRGFQDWSGQGTNLSVCDSAADGAAGAGGKILYITLAQAQAGSVLIERLVHQGRAWQNQPPAIDPWFLCGGTVCRWKCGPWNHGVDGGGGPKTTIYKGLCWVRVELIPSPQRPKPAIGA